MLNGPTLSDRVHRARVIRLAKAAVKGDDSPVVSSFNVEALALEHVDSDDTIAESLRDVFLDGADALELGDTPDPAGVSDPIKLPDSISRTEVVNRLREFGGALEAAIDNSDDEERVRTELARIFPDYIDVEASGKEALANALITGDSAKVASVVGAGSSGLKSTAAYGDG